MTRSELNQIGLNAAAVIFWSHQSNQLVGGKISLSLPSQSMTTSKTPAATSGTGTTLQKLKQSLRAATKKQDAKEPRHNGIRRESFVNPSLQQGSVSSPALQITTARTSLDDWAPSCPEIREVIRSATAVLCREMVRPPPNLRIKDDWDHVERRLHPLMRAQRVWSKSPSPGFVAFASPAEERERKQFADALRDGYVLCQYVLHPSVIKFTDFRRLQRLLNKLRSRSIVRPDPRESTKTNITKFLAACASLGLPDEELFAQNDLVEAGPESLARVARTVLRLVDFIQREEGEEGRGRGKVIRGQGIAPEGKAKATIKTSPLPPTPTKVVSPSPSSSPYGRSRNQHIRSHPNSPTTSSRAAASTPNLLATPTKDRHRDHRLRDGMRSTSPLDDRPLPRTPVNRPTSRTATRIKLDDKMRPLPPSPPAPGPSSPKPNIKAKMKVNGSTSALNSDEADVGNDEEDVGYASYAPPLTPPIIKPPPKSPLRKVSKVGMGLSGSGDGGGRETNHGREKEKEDRGQEKDKHSTLFSWARKAASPRTVTNVRAGVGTPSSGSNPVLVSMGPGPSTPNPAPRKPIVRVNTPATPMPTSIPSGVEELGIGVGMRSSIADSTRALMGDDESLRDDPFQSSPMPPLRKSTLSHPHIGLTHTPSRQSMSSDVTTTTTTVITTVSSLLDGGASSSPGRYGKGYTSGARSSSGNVNNANYATIRSVTTDMTSEPPASFGRSSSKSWVVPEENGTTRVDRERKLSGVPGGLDLARVAEEREPDGSGCGEGDCFPPSPASGRDQQPSPVHLRKGKWPDDFISAFGSVVVPESPSPPRKLAIVGRARGDDTSGAGPFPRRPTHRPRHSIDSPNSVSVGLLPKEAVMARTEASPEGRSSPSPSGRVVLRRHSSNRPSPINIGNGGIGMSPGSTPTSDSVAPPSAVGGSRAGTPGPKPYSSATAAATTPTSSTSAAPPGSVPFPRTISAEYQSHHTHYQPSPTPRSSDPGAASPSSTGVDVNTSSDRSRLRGRFQSDIEGSSAVARRKTRPNSYDELGYTAVGAGVAGFGAGGGGGPKRVRLRSRFESMVNLGASSSADVSASDLLTARDSIVDGSDAVRHRLVVREDGKPPTHFVSGLIYTLYL